MVQADFLYESSRKEVLKRLKEINEFNENNGLTEMRNKLRVFKNKTSTNMARSLNPHQLWPYSLHYILPV